MKMKTRGGKYGLFGLPLFDYEAFKAEEDTDYLPVREGKRIEVVQEKNLTPRYVVGSWFLEECFNTLCGRPVEMMRYVSGLDLGNCFTLERLVDFEFRNQSPSFVRGEITSSHNSLLEIGNHGYCLTAWVHSHPGCGENSVFASSTDMENQRRLEAGKYRAIGLVFSRDGYIRSFADKLKFSLKVLGKGVEKHDENLFKLSQTQSLQNK